MINTDNLCMSCMREIGNEKKCPHCGFLTDSLQRTPYLPIRTVVGNRYIIGKLLEFNGEGATYIAWDITGKTPVTVREFMPEAIAERMPDGVFVGVKPGCEMSFRDCMQSYSELWSKLIRLSGLTALMRALELVEDYGTVYAVSEYCEGITLREFLLGSKTGYLPWEKARQLFLPALSTLGTLHKSGIIHRGISPVTLLIGKDGKIRITGFCIQHSRTARGELTAQLFPGYAAVEQYGFKGQQGTWTDVYAFAAVLYRALIGNDPIEATTRVTNDRLMVPGKFAEQLPECVINALVNALQIMPEDRTRTVEQFYAEITDAVAPSSAAFSQPVPQPREAEYRRAATPLPSQPVRRAPVQEAARRESASAPSKSAQSSIAVSVKAAIICILAGFAVFVIVSLTLLPDEYNVFSALFEGEESTTSSVDEETQTCMVLNFVGKSYTETVRKDLYKSQFEFSAEYVYDDEVEMGYIIAQSILPETQVPKGTQIVLTVSKGIEKIILPDVVGQKYDSAYSLLTSLGFKVSKNERLNTGNHTAGEVVSMSKTAGAQYDKGQEIILQVYDEVETEAPEPETEPATEQPTLPASEPTSAAPVETPPTSQDIIGA